MTSVATLLEKDAPGTPPRWGVTGPTQRRHRGQPRKLRRDYEWWMNGSVLTKSIHYSALHVWSKSPSFILIKPTREEIVPISPTSQGGNRPAQRKPWGIQWIALPRSAIHPRIESSSSCICLWIWQWLQKMEKMSFDQKKYIYITCCPSLFWSEEIMQRKV